MNGFYIVIESLNKVNIFYVVQYMGRNVSFVEYLLWISNEVKDCGLVVIRIIIYIQIIKQCVVVYLILKIFFGDKIYSLEERILKIVLLEMFYFCIFQLNKEYILIFF